MQPYQTHLIIDRVSGDLKIRRVIVAIIGYHPLMVTISCSKAVVKTESIEISTGIIYPLKYMMSMVIPRR
jgi:hypothetical protein